MKTNSKYMREYWRGYHSAKYETSEHGDKSAQDEYLYDLNGRTDAFCNGYRRYLRDYNKKKAKRIAVLMKKFGGGK